jgi:hypothetical protein
MDTLQEQHERWVGDQVIDWYNSRHGSNFRFHGRCGEAPDLEYRDDGRFLRIEVGTAYYDGDDAKFMWLRARQHPDAPKQWSGSDFDAKLVEDINKEIKDKCANSYGPNCVLAVCVLPFHTSANDMEARLEEISIPANNPFDGIYLYGEFPAPIEIPLNPPERKVWQLAPTQEA